MKLIKSDNHQCLAASFAMALDLDLEDMFKIIGHDGLEKISDDPIPWCYRSFHPQEMIDVCYHCNYACTIIEDKPQLLRYKGKLSDITMDADRLQRYMERGTGVLFGATFSAGHACAWDGKMIYDPRGAIYSYDERRGHGFHITHFCNLELTK